VVGPVVPQDVAPTAAPTTEQTTEPTAEPVGTAPEPERQADEPVTVAAAVVPVVKALAVLPHNPLPLARFRSLARVAARPELRAAITPPVLRSRLRETLRLASAVSENGGPPVLLLLVAFAFLGAQDRIDRHDPKLKLAPVHGHQELVFKPISRGSA
jgi:hypothetical protein